MRELVFRAARPDEVGVCVDLCLLAVGREMQRYLGGLKRGVDVREVLMVLCGARDTEFSWRYFTLVERDGEVMGGLCAFPTEDYPILIRALPSCLEQEAGIGFWGLARLLIRALGYNLFMPDAPKPAASLHISVGAVFPAHQSKGVAMRALSHIVDRARAEGYASICFMVDRSNLPARAVCASLGFQVTPPRRFSRKCLMTLLLQ